MTVQEYRAYISGKAHKKQSRKGKTTANGLTKQIIAYLSANGYEVWRNNVMGVWDRKIFISRIMKNGKVSYSALPKTINGWYKLVGSCYRKSHERKGVPDIVGYCKKTGRMIAVEVKVGKDKLRIEQTHFLKQLNRRGGIGIVAKGNIDAVVDRVQKIKR